MIGLEPHLTLNQDEKCTLLYALRVALRREHFRIGAAKRSRKIHNVVAREENANRIHWMIEKVERVKCS